MRSNQYIQKKTRFEEHLSLRKKPFVKFENMYELLLVCAKKAVRKSYGLRAFMKGVVVQVY
jgi:hypothetical protein